MQGNSDDFRPSRLAESALSQLYLRAADYRALSSLEPEISIGRHVSDRNSIRDSIALVDFVAVAEVFATNRLQPFLPAGTNVLKWSSRINAFKNHAGLDLDMYSRKSEFFGFVDVRNAFQHNLGRLTDFQLGKHKLQVLAQIAATGVHLNGDLLTVRSADVVRCLDVCTDMVNHIDKSL